jgi:hypothetical protein
MQNLQCQFTLGKRKTIMLLDAPKNYVISFSSFSNIEEADDAFCKSALGLLDAEFCPLGGTLLEDDALRASPTDTIFHSISLDIESFILS